MTQTHRRPLQTLVVLALLALVVVLQLVAGAPARAHGFSSTVFVDLTSPERGTVRAELGLEYDLLLVSVAEAEGDDALFQEGQPAFDAGDDAAMASALEDHRDSVLAYVAGRFEVLADDAPCPPAPYGQVRMEERDGVPYAVLSVDYECPAASEHVVRATIFPDDEGFVRDTKTILTYDLDLRSGSAVLDGGHPSFSTHQSSAQRFWEFYRLGVEHLLTGLDHLLFLLALIAGSRRLREVVLAATAFTLAHSVTFVLAALGVVQVPASVVEPVIALSIALVAGWHLVRLWRLGDHADDVDTLGGGHLSLDRAGWVRLAVVFSFGLVHGLGFAGALGIDDPWSWQLLWSLLVFNLGIESVQLVLIALTFPLLALMRHRTPRAGRWATGAVAAVAGLAGLVWFVERVAGG